MRYAINELRAYALLRCAAYARAIRTHIRDARGIGIVELLSVCHKTSVGRGQCIEFFELLY
jgi:hypothetical protein